MANVEGKQVSICWESVNWWKIADDSVNWTGHFGSIQNVHNLWASKPLLHICHQETFLHIHKNAHCTIIHGLKKLAIDEM